MGSALTARQMISEAKKAGATSVKFQKYDPIKLLGKDSPYLGDARQLSWEELRELKQYADGLDIEWFCSVFAPEDVQKVEDIGVRRHKVASRAVNDLELLGEINKTRKPVFMSTGLSKPDEVRKALDALRDCSVTLLYCVAKYPTPIDGFDFWQMFRLANDFKLPVGLSSHCNEIWPSVKAVSLGAVAVEQHVTINKQWVNCDTTSSLDFTQLRQLVDITKNLERL